MFSVCLLIAVNSKKDGAQRLFIWGITKRLFLYTQFHFGTCTAGADSLLHQAWFGSMRGEGSRRRRGWRRGSSSRSGMRFRVMAQYVPEKMLSWWFLQPPWRYAVHSINISSLTLAAIKRQIISGSERHSTSCAASYVIAIVGNHSLVRLLRMSRKTQTTLLVFLQEVLPMLQQALEWYVENGSLAQV